MEFTLTLCHAVVLYNRHYMITDLMKTARWMRTLYHVDHGVRHDAGITIEIRHLAKRIGGLEESPLSVCISLGCASLV